MTRRTNVIVGVGTLVIASFVMWWLTRREHPRMLQTTRSESAAKRLESAAAITATPMREVERRLQQEDRARTIVESIERTNVSINFWGKVVDQNQQPIDGVKVRYSYSTEHGNLSGSAWGEQKIHKNEVATDDAGVFTVHGIKGHTLSIESLVKEGYNYASRGAKVYDYYGSKVSGKFTPERAHPVVFVMVNQAAAEPLISYGGAFGKTMRLPGDGTPVRWSLWKGQPDPNGELKVTLKRDPSVLARVGQTVSWTAKVGVIDGGVVEASPDEPVYRAPAEGYVSELDYPKVEQKHGVPARSFYIKTADGNYGRIELDLYADDEGPTARCLIKTSINPSGSQNLESGSGE